MSTNSRNNFPDENFNAYCKFIQTSPDAKTLLNFFPKTVKEYPGCPIFYFYWAEFLKNQKELLKSLEIINNGLAIYEENLRTNRSFFNIFMKGDLKIELYKLKIQVLDILNVSPSEIKQNLKVLKEIAEANDFENLEEIPAFIKKYSEKYNLNIIKFDQNTKNFDKSRKNSQELNPEAKGVFELMENSNKHNIMKEEGLPVNVVSMSWFVKWKKYTNFHLISGEKFEEYPSIELSQENEKNRHTERKFPGPINQEDVLSNEKILIDPDKIKNYCNMILKTGMEENRDFLIVSHKVWKYLFKIYGGQEIKRYIVSVNDDSNLTHAEICLKKINVIMWPLINNQEITRDVLYLSKKEAIKDLKEKLFRIYNLNFKIEDKYKNPGNSRIWKVDARCSIEQLIESFKLFTDTSRNSKKTLIFKGKKLEDSCPLEESELSETDYVVIEFKINDDWILTSEEKAQNTGKSQCSFCKMNNKPLYYCECRQVKYCDMTCLRAHRTEHKESCQKAKKEISTQNDLLRHFGINVNKKFTKDSKKGVTGLQNLGNTCFMNSAIQCLSNTSELTQYFLSNEFLKDLNKSNPLGTGGYLISAYSELIKELWMGSEGYISPWDLKKVIGKFAPQFSGYSQQDSQELLSYMLDGLHEDLNRIVKKPFVEDIEFKNQKDEELSMESWSNYLKRNQSIIIDLFAGQYKSRLDCPECNKISITFDPFLSISLPVPHLTTLSCQFFLIFKDSKKIPYKMSLTLPTDSKCQDALDYLEKNLSIPKETMIIALMKDHAIVDNVAPSKPFKHLEDHEKGNVLIYEVEQTDPNQSSLKIDLSMFHQRKKGDESADVSYCRVFKVSLEVSYEYILLQIYKNFRVYLKNFISTVEEKPSEFQIDLDNDDPKTIKSEYMNIFFSKNFEPPYKVYYLKADERVELVYSSKYSFSQITNDKEPQEYNITFNLVYAQYITLDELKMNRCQESPLEDKPKELKKASIYECLDLFTKEEILDVENAWYCSNCKSHKQAKKKMEIYKTPKVLILHLKRFKTSKINSIGSYYYTSGSSKINNLVEFPLKELNLTKYIKSNSGGIYDLFGVSNHYGGLYGGHYTASCVNHMDGKWYDFNDSNTEEIEDSNKIVSEAAYVLFYRKREVSNEINMTQQPLLIN